MKTVEESQPSSEELPFPIEHIPPEVFHTKDRTEIAEILIEKLKSSDIDPYNVVFCGFEAATLLRQNSFGERNNTFAVGANSMADDEEHSPIKYLESEMPYKPAIGVFWLDKLIGSSADHPVEYLTEVSSDELRHNPSFIYWATKDGQSLDTAAAKLFLFET